MPLLLIFFRELAFEYMNLFEYDLFAMIRNIFPCCILPFAIVSTTIVFAQSSPPAMTMKPFGEVISYAEETSALHSKHTHPYHLKASIIETANPDSGYRAEIEEFFQSEKNWRRTVKAPGLSWTQEMRDGHIQDQYTGDYAPLWLRELLNGIADPIPQHKQLEGMQQPFGVLEGGHANSCMRNLPDHLGTR